ncbi:hypothetical protein [Helicobacter pylori]|uniref:hypothetical protein n=1 Tax=Helicobacter pylori TaxID=210 RepID=UPI003AFF69D0
MRELEQSQQALKNEKAELLREKENLTKANADLTEKNKTLTTEKAELTEKNKTLTTEKDNLTKANADLKTEKDNLTNQLNASQKQVKELEQSQQALKNENAELLREKDNLTKEKDNLTKANAELTEKNQKLTTEKDKLEQKYAPYKKLEKLYEVFLEVKGCLNYGFVPQTHSAMDLIASVLSDSKYYLESLYNKASQELSDKKSDKGEKLAELFDLLFEYVKDNKFERLKEPSAYDSSTCKKLYPEQNTSGKMQRVVLIGYTYDKKTTYYTIVDMGS